MNTLAKPFYALLFAVGGLALALLWYNVIWILPLALVAIVWLIVGIIQRRARSLVTSDPKRALRLMEWRLAGIAAAAAGAAAIVIVLAVEWTPSDEVAAPLKQIIAAAVAALSAFVAGITIEAGDVDGNIAEYVEAEFQKRFIPASHPAETGKLQLPDDSKALKAVFTYNEYGWTDWSRKTRRERIDELDKHLAKARHGSAPTPARTNTP